MSSLAPITQDLAKGSHPTTKRKIRHDIHSLTRELDSLLAQADAEIGEEIVTSLLRATLLAQYQELTSEQLASYSGAERMVFELVRRAVAGDLRAMALIFERVEGRPKESRTMRESVQKIAVLVRQLAPELGVEIKPLPSHTNLAPKLGPIAARPTPENGWGTLESHLSQPPSDAEFTEVTDNAGLTVDGNSR